MAGNTVRTSVIRYLLHHPLHGSHSTVPGSAIHGKNMLAMYRGQNQETTPSLFSARDEGYPAEGLPRIGRPPKEAAFRLRFGLALFASTALHILLLLIVPGIPYSTAAPERPDPDMLSVSLISQVPRPPQPSDTAELPQTAVQPPEMAADPVRPTAPTTPAVPIPLVAPNPPITPSAPTEPTQVIADSQAIAVDSVQARENNPQTIYNQEPVKAPETQMPSSNPGTAAQAPDAARIGEEFKLAFIKLLAYPETARRRGVQGTVGLKIVMDGDGRIIEALVSQTSGSSLLDRAAVHAALATPGPLVGPGRRLELAIRVGFEAGQILTRP